MYPNEGEDGEASLCPMFPDGSSGSNVQRWETTGCSKSSGQRDEKSAWKTETELSNDRESLSDSLNTA